MEQERFIREILPLRERLLGYAQRLLNSPEDSEDVIQEVFLKLWSIRSELKRYRSVPALSMTITRHLCINRIRLRRQTAEPIDGLTLPSEASSPYQQLEAKDSAGYVGKIMAKLPELQQLVLRMKHIEGMETEEIARLLGSQPEAVRVNLSRARKKVREMYFKLQDK
jgi:RNA polymerase sigma-70 factor (ECF subfamily)